MVIALQSSISHSTIIMISKNKNKIMEGIKTPAPLKAVRLTKIQEEPISDMEKLKGQTQKHILLSTTEIMAKVKTFLVMLQEKAEPDY